MSEKKSLLEFLGPKKSFGAGFISAIVIFIIIAFVAQLAGGVEFSGKKKTTTFGEAGTKTADSGNTGTTAGQQQVELNTITDEDHIRGDLETAQVVLVEFSDYDCPFCQRFHPTMQQVLDEYGDQVAWVYRHFPLDSLHPEARTKSEASECVAELGGNDAFWAFTDIMYDDTRSVTAANLADVAAEVGVDRAEFQTCLDEGRYEDEVQKDYQDAIASTGQGTPHTIVVSRDGQRVPVSGAVPFEQIKSVIDSFLQ